MSDTIEARRNPHEHHTILRCQPVDIWGHGDYLALRHDRVVSLRRNEPGVVVTGVLPRQVDVEETVLAIRARRSRRLLDPDELQQAGVRRCYTSSVALIYVGFTDLRWYGMFKIEDL